MNSKTKRLLETCRERIDDLEDEQTKLIFESRFYRSMDLPWAMETEMQLDCVRDELKSAYDRYAELHRHCCC